MERYVAVRKLHPVSKQEYYNIFDGLKDRWAGPMRHSPLGTGAKELTKAEAEEWIKQKGEG